MNLAPITLFVYNRPWHTKQTVEALQKNKLSTESELFVYSDGPRDTEESIVSVAEVRKYLSIVSGFKKVTIIKSSKNQGLANSVIKGVSEVVNQYGRVIVLEDDLITAPDFLYYMNQALQKYADDKQVMQLSGHMFEVDVDVDVDTDSIFLPFISSWGWATWKRAWVEFDQHSSGYEKLKNDLILRNKFNLDGSYDYYQMLETQRKGTINSWAIRWYLSVFMVGGYVLYPVRSLIHNIGFDGSGTHCGNYASAHAHIRIFANQKPRVITFPDITVNHDAYQKVKLLFSSKRTMRDKLGSLFSKICKKVGLVVTKYTG